MALCKEDHHHAYDFIPENGGKHLFEVPASFFPVKNFSYLRETFSSFFEIFLDRCFFIFNKACCVPVAWVKLDAPVC